MSTPWRNSPHRAAPAVAGREPFTVGVASATSIGLSPRWVHYSGVSPAARVAAEVLADMATMRPAGDQAPVLDRERLAYHVGVGRADKLAPILAELIEIGFLTVYDGGADPDTGRRRQRRDGRGRPVPDRFAVSLHPPAGYRGAATLTEADAAFTAARDAVYRDVEATGKTPRAGRHTIPRPRPDRSRSPQVSTVPGSRGQVEGPVPEIRGQEEFALVGAVPEIGGQGEPTVPGFRGQSEFVQVRTVPRFRGHLQIERSSISLEEREIEGSSALARGSAPPPAPSAAAAAPAGFGRGGSVVEAVGLGAGGLAERTGLDGRAEAFTEALTEPVDEALDVSLGVEAREVVRRLPWVAWAQARGKTGWRLTPADADQVQAAICEAVSVHGLSLVEAAVIGQAALSEAKGAPVVYVVNAFTRHLARRRRALTAEPLAETPLPLLDPPVRRDGPQRRSQRPEQATQDQPAAAGVDPVSVPEQVETSESSAACGMCEARAGDGAVMRTVDGGDGRCVPCPACRPGQSSAVTA
ncbi:hypothetical protein [Pseudonocardia sp. ICBG1293]|uniref:hypothetical protein n=1 Tax=Pseudonocardia sp. ICBG1293 TaxID=2844382 RepID=UPI001CCAE657|nr:hypothetical protein [Pseudonocardia sp. ICBG1293]